MRALLRNNALVFIDEREERKENVNSNVFLSLRNFPIRILH